MRFKVVFQKYVENLLNCHGSFPDKIRKKRVLVKISQKNSNQKGENS